MNTLFKASWVSALILMTSMAASAAENLSCRQLTLPQATKAERLMKTALYKGSAILVYSSNERGMIRPMGIWKEKIRTHRGRIAYRIVVDGRRLDLSSTYIGQDGRNSRKAWNLGLLSGCQLKRGTPFSIDAH